MEAASEVEEAALVVGEVVHEVVRFRARTRFDYQVEADRFLRTRGLSTIIWTSSASPRYGSYSDSMCHR